MNKTLTIQLKKDEITKMMHRIAKCDKRIAAGLSVVRAENEPGESEQQRKDRLLGMIAVRMQEIAVLIAPQPAGTAEPAAEPVT